MFSNDGPNLTNHEDTNKPSVIPKSGEVIKIAGTKPINVLMSAVKISEIIISLIFIGAINKLVKFLLQISSKNNMLKLMLDLNKKS